MSGWEPLLELLRTIFIGVMAYLMARLNRGQSAAAKEVGKAAVKVEEVKEVLHVANASDARHLSEILVVAKDTHTLVNSNMALQLSISAAALRRIADMTKEPLDDKAAVLAESALAEHNEKQAIVDRSKEPQ